MSTDSVQEAARVHCIILGDRRDQNERMAAEIIPGSLRVGLTVAEIAQMTGLTPEEVEKYAGGE